MSSGGPDDPERANEDVESDLPEKDEEKQDEVPAPSLHLQILFSFTFCFNIYTLSVLLETKKEIKKASILNSVWGKA